MPIKNQKVRTASNEEKIYCVYEYRDDNHDRDGIYYFEIDKSVEQNDQQLKKAVETTASVALVTDDVYQKRPLAQLYLDVDGDFISITFVPQEEGRISSRNGYSGKIQNGKFTPCPSQPVTCEGDIVNVNTDFTNTKNKMAIKVFELEEGTVHIEGHG